jgi:3-phosphoshikimate 1-carboxyvinyltransferase
MIRISRNNVGINGEIKLPASKSISNRLLILQYCYGNSLVIENLSESNDTVLMSTILDLLRQYQLRGDKGLLRIDTQNAGTVMRFLIPLLSVTRGHFLVTGNERMKQRPVGALVDAIRDTGADIDYLGEQGYPPLLIRGRTLTGGRIKLDASVSSQFVTALLLLAPALEDGLTLELTGIRASWPYVKMTTGILSYLGVQVIDQEYAIRIYPKKSLKIRIDVESDWSSAAFWYSMLAMAKKGKLSFPTLRKSGLQGDQQVGNLFRNLGISTSETENGITICKEDNIQENFHADFTGHPDLALPVIMTCAAEGISGTFTGLDRLRIKESDRINALARGLEKAGITFQEEFQGVWRLSGRLIHPCTLFIDDMEDHRVAMTFACLAVKGFDIILEHPDAVAKSYPSFWKDLQQIGFTCSFTVENI